MTEYRIWHTPNPPCNPYLVSVDSPAEGLKVLRIIAEYDLYLGENLIGVNAQGLEELTERGEWE